MKSETPQPSAAKLGKDEAIERKLLELAFGFHVGIEGEYGCPGATCPGVQRLVEKLRALKGVGMGPLSTMPKAEPVQPSAARLELDAAEANLGNARIALNDWVNCSTQEQLARWRQAQRRLIAAAKRVGALEVQPSAAPALDVQMIEVIIARMRHGRARFRDAPGGSDVVSATTVDDWADDLEAEVARLSAVQITEVQLPDGRPVAAPCGIDGCQYEELARLRALQETPVCQRCEGRGWIMGGFQSPIVNGIGSGGSWNEPCPECRQPFKDVSAAMAKEK